MITIQKYNSLDLVFIAAWEKLWSASLFSHCYNTPVWYAACQEAFRYQSDLIIAAYEQDRLVGVLPLVRSRRYGVSVWTSPGGDHLGISSLLVGELDVSVMRKLFEAAAEHGTINAQELTMETMRVLKDSKERWSISESSISWHTTLDHPSSEFMSAHSRKRLERIQRQQKDALQLKVYTGIEVSQHFSEMMLIEKNSFKPGDGRDVFHDARTLELYRALSQHASERTLLSILYYNAVPIAYHFGMSYRQTYEGFQTSYDLQHRKLMPGKILVLLLFQALRERGIKVVDFGRGDHPAKRQFADQSVVQYTAVHASNQLIGWCLYVVRLVHVGWNRVPDRLKRYPRMMWHAMQRLH
jgi:CelD/BcsL family acetyltransferase involved in cellulose biosynthesis